MRRAPHWALGVPLSSSELGLDIPKLRFDVSPAVGFVDRSVVLHRGEWVEASVLATAIAGGRYVEAPVEQVLAPCLKRLLQLLQALR
ncbi:MAG: hypothetical protein AAF962_14615 [Actinomycetota bacterium]